MAIDMQGAMALRRLQQEILNKRLRQSDLPEQDFGGTEADLPEMADAAFERALGPLSGDRAGQTRVAQATAAMDASAEPSLDDQIARFKAGAKGRGVIMRGGIEYRPDDSDLGKRAEYAANAEDLDRKTKGGTLYDPLAGATEEQMKGKLVDGKRVGGIENLRRKTQDALAKRHADAQAIRRGMFTDEEYAKAGDSMGVRPANVPGIRDPRVFQSRYEEAIRAEAQRAKNEAAIKAAEAGAGGGRVDIEPILMWLDQKGYDPQDPETIALAQKYADAARGNRGALPVADTPAAVTTPLSPEKAADNYVRETKKGVIGSSESTKRRFVDEKENPVPLRNILSELADLSDKGQPSAYEQSLLETYLEMIQKHPDAEKISAEGEEDAIGAPNFAAIVVNGAKNKKIKTWDDLREIVKRHRESQIGPF